MIQKKRLMRSEIDKKVLGVCAGLGRYFGIDPLLVRILFVVATFGGFGSAIPIYLILAFVMPKGDPMYDDADLASDVDLEDAARTLGGDVVKAVRSATDTAANVGGELYKSGRSALSSAAKSAADVIEPKGNTEKIADAASDLGDDVVESVNKAVERAKDGMKSSASE